MVVALVLFHSEIAARFIGCGFALIRKLSDFLRLYGFLMRLHWTSRPGFGSFGFFGYLERLGGW